MIASIPEEADLRGATPLNRSTCLLSDLGKYNSKQVEENLKKSSEIDIPRLENSLLEFA